MAGRHKEIFKFKAGDSLFLIRPLESNYTHHTRNHLEQLFKCYWLKEESPPISSSSESDANNIKSLFGSEETEMGNELEKGTNLSHTLLPQALSVSPMNNVCLLPKWLWDSYHHEGAPGSRIKPKGSKAS